MTGQERKHTPGPWSLCAHLATHDECCTCGYRGSIWSGDGEAIVCEIGSSPDRDDKGTVQGHTMPQASRKVQFADAHLIATAPELYDALERFRNEAILQNKADIAGWDVWIAYADEVLAKARGQS